MKIKFEHLEDIEDVETFREVTVYREELVNKYCINKGYFTEPTIDNDYEMTITANNRYTQEYDRIQQIIIIKFNHLQICEAMHDESRLFKIAETNKDIAAILEKWNVSIAKSEYAKEEHESLMYDYNKVLNKGTISKKWIKKTIENTIPPGFAN